MRLARQGEVDCPGEVIFVEDDGSYVALSRVQDRAGTTPWIHDLVVLGDDRTAAVRLLLKAREQIREWGFDSFLANVQVDSEIMGMMIQKFKIEQVIFRGDA